MALVTNQQLALYYNSYMNIDVTFNKQVARAIGLLTDKSFLRLLGYQLPCIVYSSSMVGAKVIANINQDLFTKIREANNLVSLRFCLKDSDKPDPLSFFVASRVGGYNPYSEEHKDLNLLVLNYTQRPSDDLIAVLGQLLEANINSKKRSEERIEINADSMRKMGLASRDGLLHVDDVPRKCIVRDLSFSGASILVTGVAKFLVEKDVRLSITVDDGKSTHHLAGKIIRFEEIPEQPGIGAAGIHFDEQRVSMEYRMRLNEYLGTQRKPSS